MSFTEVLDFTVISAWFLQHGPRLLFILLGALVLHWFLRGFARRISSWITRGSRDREQEREQRVSTLAGVLQSGGLAAIYILAGLMILDELGVAIAPLLGGVAVVGLAVAFAAQSLIKDWFCGFMILLENQYRVNDVVRIGETAGLVERITLRITVLRDLEGVAHFIPHGQITQVSNLTHGWSRAVLDIGVAYKEDVNRVMDVLAAIGRELREDPQYGKSLLEDPEVPGIESLSESAVVIRLLVKTQPLKQWEVKRELLRRIKIRFDELGIEIPFPHRTVYHRDLPGQAGPLMRPNSPAEQ